MRYMMKGGTKMNGQCYTQSCEMRSRSFLTKKEKAEMLTDYKKQLENELKGVSERIKELSSDEE